jgi:hypothetical protein
VHNNTIILLEKGGGVVGDIVEITIDAEAILEA